MDKPGIPWMLVVRLGPEEDVPWLERKDPLAVEDLFIFRSVDVSTPILCFAFLWLK